MSNNYLYTNEPGTSRRRAKRVIIENPSDKDWKPTVTFVEEERIIMADGSEKLVEVGQLIVPIDETVLALEFPQYNVETGETTNESRQGSELLMSIFQQLADTYITLATRRDISEQPPVENVVNDTEQPPVENVVNDTEQPPVENVVNGTE